MRSLILIALFVLFVYPFVVAPAILAIWARRRGKDAAANVKPPTELPYIALIICAFNERGIIRQKIENALASEYPREKLAIVVISDGSEDGTADIVREYGGAGVKLEDHKIRRGKIANLNEVVPSRSEQIVVLSDANALYDRFALMRLAARFGDTSVGCVSGKVVLTDTTPELRDPTDQYYSVEWRMQEDSSLVYSMVGADGAMYALRRDLFCPCPTDTLIEDFVIPMSVISQGRRVVFEPQALGWEKGVGSLREEFRRKVRIAAGVAQGLVRGSAWPANAPPRFWFIFVSHKLLRWVSPITGALAVLALAVWPHEPVARLMIIGLVTLVGLAFIRLITGWKNRLVSTPFYFLFLQGALAVGLVKGLTGRQTVLWAKSDR